MYKCKWGEIVCKAEKEEHEEEKHVNTINYIQINLTFFSIQLNFILEIILF